MQWMPNKWLKIWLQFGNDFLTTGKLNTTPCIVQHSHMHHMLRSNVHACTCTCTCISGELSNALPTMPKDMDTGSTQVCIPDIRLGRILHITYHHIIDRHACTCILALLVDMHVHVHVHWHYGIHC